jgi:hypothetical protein
MKLRPSPVAQDLVAEHLALARHQPVALAGICADVGDVLGCTLLLQLRSMLRTVRRGDAAVSPCCSPFALAAGSN